MRIIVLLAVVASLTACFTAKPSQYQTWASDPAPDYWSLRAVWAFMAVRDDDQIERSMTIRFTDAVAETCESGDWKTVEIIEQSPLRDPRFVGEAAYLLNGRALQINLTANICDNYTLYSGELTKNGFVGIQRVGHMLGGEDIGPVYGIRWHWRPD